MLRVAILGASGFVGNRAVEMLHLGGVCEVRPIVRAFGSMALPSRFSLDCRVSDGRDIEALARAFEGCDMVVHTITGDSKVIVGSVEPTYLAADIAGVKRIVYLSSASVHGQDPPPGTDESSPLNDKQLVPYNNDKVRAEWKFQRLRRIGSVELVTLRPGIVFGPRSPRWTAGLAEDLLSGRAYLVDGGAGVCNSVYVDNLVHAIRLCLEAPSRQCDGETFFVSDAETVTWAQYVKSVADALGVDMSSVRNVPCPDSLVPRRSPLDAIRSLKPVQAVLPILPRRLKRAAKAAVLALEQPASPSKVLDELPPDPVVTLEMAQLHRCRCKLPSDKASRLIGYIPPVEFSEACRKTASWLAFAGYPVV